MPSAMDPMNHNPASGIFTTQAPSKRKRRGSRDVPEREAKDGEFKGPAESYAEKDRKLWMIWEIYGKQEELDRTHRGRRESA